MASNTFLMRKRQGSDCISIVVLGESSFDEVVESEVMTMVLDVLFFRASRSVKQHGMPLIFNSLPSAPTLELLMVRVCLFACLSHPFLHSEAAIDKTIKKITLD